VFRLTPYRKVVVLLTNKTDIKGYRISVRFDEDEEIQRQHRFIAESSTA
jgi:hypothetical protein